MNTYTSFPRKHNCRSAKQQQQQQPWRYHGGREYPPFQTKSIFKFTSYKD